jgi:CRP/FNR family transcriptional regulator, cyclic AMP receptor protein
MTKGNLQLQRPKREAIGWDACSHFDKESRAEPVLPSVNQESLAQMVGTTRLRISHFMNEFRKLDFIDYSDSGGLTVHRGLLSVVAHD